jgi:hypothetical protein
MGNAVEGLAQLGIAIVAGVLLGIAALLIIYKMIDGEFPFLQGMVALFVDLMLILMAVSASSAVVPGVIFVVVLAGMSLFPYAADELEKAELREFDTERLVRAYEAFAQRPDNVSAVFEVARRLYSHGIKGNAIGIASAALNTLSKKQDSVSNRSYRDMFRSEEQTLKTWNREAAKHPNIMKPVPCPRCGHLNPLEYIWCEKCQAPYLIETAENMHLRPKVYGKLLLTFAVLAAVIVLSAALGVMVSGLLCVVLLVLVLAGAGYAIHRLFKPPTPY